MMSIIQTPRKCKLIYSNREHISRYLTKKEGSWLEGGLQKGTRKLLRVMKMFIIFIVLLVFQRYINVLKSINSDTLVCAVYIV